MLTEYGDGMLTCFHCGPLCVEMLDDGMEGADRRWRVTCASCRLSGPERPSTDEAKEAWNRIQRALERADIAVEEPNEALWLGRLYTDEERKAAANILANPMTRSILEDRGYRYDAQGFEIPEGVPIKVDVDELQRRNRKRGGGNGDDA